MTGHRHSTRTPASLRPAKNFGDLRRPDATETYFIRPKRGKKGSSFRLEEANVHARMSTATQGGGRGVTGRERGNAKRQQKLALEGGVRPTGLPPPQNARARIMNISESR
jgi:hypothetical protein